MLSEGGIPLLVTLSLAAHSEEPLYIQLYQALKEEILSGRAAPGAKLPSIRQLAQHLGLSRNPVEAAYDQLAGEGYIVSRPKSGYYTADLELLDESGLLLSPAKTPQSTQTAPKKASGISDSVPASPRPDRRDPSASPPIRFDIEGMDAEHFPFPLWRKLTMEVLQPASRELLGYGDRRGEPGLRELISAYLRQTRGVRCRPDQVILTSGTQQSMLLVSLLLRGTHPDLAVEAAMDPRIAALLRQQGFRLHPVPLEDDGFSVDLLTAKQHRAVYLTPSHQFPYGMVLPAAKRLKLLQWAAARGGYIIEDDYDCEFRFEGRPVPALQGMDNAGRVVYLGTFSKSLSPAFRLSYCVLPPELLGRYETELAWHESSASRLTQKTMELFMQRGLFERHIRRMRQHYRHKRALLLEAVARHMGGQVHLSGSTSGLHVLLAVDSSLPEQVLQRRAADAGVEVRTVSSYHMREAGEVLAGSAGGAPETAYVLLGFGGLPEEMIEEGIRRMAAAWFR
ncbi:MULTISPECIES: MocR-like pyridoxine biosynthesis transcription factor PdxR [Paenibacillus]|uniref:MocR-like pyridoxine biosynthesis transcription factor PdxR n=1 Tax=Paenibacillus TaxID=44249 RepID=UPI0022B93766|nr:PLP-dependent aminotransferase family protein [Paenibacillus caseinilyticus]MCZ8524041.1 PLP-dependent aminotransferase family protein [Paenibacillus caseinilyticus]